jgi:hypothetical protein
MTSPISKKYAIILLIIISTVCRAQTGPCGAVEIPWVSASMCSSTTYTFGDVIFPAAACITNNPNSKGWWGKTGISSTGFADLNADDIPFGGAMDCLMAVFTGPCGSLTQIACDDNSGSAPSMPYVGLSGRTPGERFWVFVWEKNGTANENFQLCRYDGGDVVLPIKLLSFDAIPNYTKNTVSLEWVTTSEINNDYFSLEKSVDAVNWKAFSQIAGGGNSNTVLNYSTIDVNPYAGGSYYRLKQTDFDGKTSYSGIRAVNFKRGIKLLIYPNPAKNNVTVEIEGGEKMKVMIKNSLGQELKIVPRIEKNHFVYDTSNLSNGIYFVVITGKGKTSSKKLWINKK